MTLSAALTLLFPLAFSSLSGYLPCICLSTLLIFLFSINPTFPIFCVPVVSLPSPVYAWSFHLNTTSFTHYLNSSKNTSALSSSLTVLFIWCPCLVILFPKCSQVVLCFSPKTVLIRTGHLTNFFFLWGCYFVRSLYFCPIF